MQTILSHLLYFVPNILHVFHLLDLYSGKGTFLRSVGRTYIHEILGLAQPKFFLLSSMEELHFKAGGKIITAMPSYQRISWVWH